jgi:DNA-binding transcriptional regulator YiaG
LQCVLMKLVVPVDEACHSSHNRQEDTRSDAQEAVRVLIESIQLAPARCLMGGAPKVTGMTITGEQLKAARELIGLSRLALAVHLQVGLARVAEFEEGRPALPSDILAPLVRALEATGVIFVAESTDEPGVRLRQAK